MTFWRSPWKLAAAVLLIVAVGCGWWTWPYWTQSVRLSHNYAAEFNTKLLAAPADQRAWPRYRDAAIEINAKTDAKIHAGELAEDWLAQNSSSSDPRVEAFLREIEPELEQVRQASRLPSLGYLISDAYSAEELPLLTGAEDKWRDRKPSDNPSLLNTPSLTLDVCPDLAQMLIVDADWRMRRNDASGAVADLLATIAIARHLREVARTIEDLVAFRILQRTMAPWNESLIERPDFWTEDQLAAMQAGFASFADGKFQDPLDYERALFDDTLQRYYTDDGHGDGVIDLTRCRPNSAYTPAGTNRWWASVLAPLYASRREVHDAYHSLLDEFDVAFAKPLWQRKSIDQGNQARWDALNERDHWLIFLLLPSAKMHDRYEGVAQQLDATLVATALARYYKRHGDWPDSLDKLVPDFLAAIPPDRFTGDPLAYRLINSKPLLYSRGPDGVDDRGVAAQLDAENVPEEYVKNPNGTTAPWQGALVSEYNDLKGDWILWPIMLAPLTSMASPGTTP